MFREECNTGAAFDQDKTAALIEDAAITVVQQSGVFCGLSIKNVADTAGVNRGLVYHYFGSRRRLIVESLSRYVDKNLIDQLPPVSSAACLTRRMLQVACEQYEAFRALAMLVTDGERTALLTPANAIRQGFERDQERGVLRSDVNAAALYSVIIALTVGYALLRRQLAGRFDVPVLELDDEVRRLATGMVEGFTFSGSPSFGLR
ncbi:TetR/AcrR family transcriptional regulator [Hoyosella altamirensis]|uniref:AcrR family transcriptional regulator n=1 Tax=Hoyosella altamirensis TaxID=616997 RepID=A0A839RSV7_9ACTN|nr:TetR/AcrR family transcriptional regulator [Hoyosella altamirensis]MBB3039439.1 AcrR family transcriptional regulator [Hoyosella altamirensis]